jgi:hypothetical protein
MMSSTCWKCQTRCTLHPTLLLLLWILLLLMLLFLLLLNLQLRQHLP